MSKLTKAGGLRVEGDICYIPLTMGLEAIIDISDLDLVSGYKWRARKSRNTFYARATESRLIGGREVSMHRLIIGAKKEEITDHKNRNGLDNRRSNLRLASHGQNVINTPARNMFGFKGVSFDPRCKSRPWQALCRVRGKNVSAGFYETAEAAARAYDKAAIEVHGEYAFLNFPPALEAQQP